MTCCAGVQELSADSLLSSTAAYAISPAPRFFNFKSHHHPPSAHLSSMKLIVAGANGFVASEVIRQSLLMREVTSVIALSRQPVSVGSGAGSSKLKTVIVKDYDFYPDDVKKEFADANACIWYALFGGGLHCSVTRLSSLT